MDRVPRTAEEVAALDAAYQPFEAVATFAGQAVDTGRWQRHADALDDAVRAARPAAWPDLQERFSRAAALESSAVSELVRPTPDITAVVLRESVADDEWWAYAESTGLVAECQRRALVLASEAARGARAIDTDFIALLQDVIVESQQTYTVSTDSGAKVEVELPRRRYKQISNYLLRAEGGLVAFAPAERVPEEMARLEAELSTPAFLALHPAIRGAFLHLAITRIHPFADGNGRLARTLASIPLLSAVGLPMVLLADQWPDYESALHDADAGNPAPMIDLFFRCQVNTMSLATTLLHRDDARRARPLNLQALAAPERILLDLAAVELRELLRRRDAYSTQVVPLGAPSARLDGLRVVIGDPSEPKTAVVDLRTAPDPTQPGWYLLSTSNGEVLEASRADLLPAPAEILQLRVHTWLSNLLPAAGRHDRVLSGERDRSARGLFVLGVPRSGTTMMGNYLGSHPDVLGLAEYGGFYVAHSVAPAYLARLPGREHDALLTQMQALAVEHARDAASAQGHLWYCDATPWNLEIAGRIATQDPDAVFVLMLRHFAGTVLSLRTFAWAGETLAHAAEMWVRLNACIEQLPIERTIIVSYDALAADPAGVLAGLGEALAHLGIDPRLLDRAQLAVSHASLIGKPRPTVAVVIDGKVVLRPIGSLDQEHWTPEVHDVVWPIVADLHRAMARTFGDAYTAPERPAHVAADQW